MREPGVEREARDAGARLASNIALVAAIVMHVIVGVFYLNTQLVAPLYAALVLWAVWIGFAFLLWRQRRRVVMVLAIPFVAAAVWGGVMWLGDVFLGWTA